MHVLTTASAKVLQEHIHEVRFSTTNMYLRATDPYWPPSAATCIFTITSAYTRHWIIKQPWNSSAPAI